MKNKRQSPEGVLKRVWNQYEILQTDTIILGVSGGIDSMALLCLVAEEHPLDQIIVCHVNHSIRTESVDDALFVEEFCKKRGIRSEILTVDIAHTAHERKISIEEAGRGIRYGFFERIRGLEKWRFVITAHHKNDSVETVLFNLARGSKLRWLSGIQERQGTLLRPLLSLEKSELEMYLQEAWIPHREDKSNADPSYLRNRIRLSILPELAHINPEVVNTIDRFSKYARELDAMMEGFIGFWLSKNSISESDFANLRPILRKTLIEKIYAEVHGTTVWLNAGNIEEIERFILTANGWTEKQLRNLIFKKDKRTITWYSTEAISG